MKGKVPWSWVLLGVLALGVAQMLPLSVSYAQEREQEASNPPYLPGAALAALILATCHVFAPQIRRVLEKREGVVASFGGGLAVAYVFLHLLPELEAGHAFLGRIIFFVALASFVVFYGLEDFISVRLRGQSERNTLRWGFTLKLVNLWVYNWLIVYGLPEQYIKTGMMGAVPIALAFVLHLIHKDYKLGEEYPPPFNTWGRFVLAVAPIAGWVTALVARSHEEAITDIFVALLAGVTLYSVFKEELPTHEESRFSFFFLGAIVFLAVALIAGLS